MGLPFLACHSLLRTLGSRHSCPHSAIYAPRCGCFAKHARPKKGFGSPVIHAFGNDEFLSPWAFVTIRWARKQQERTDQTKHKRISAPKNLQQGCLDKKPVCTVLYRKTSSKRGAVGCTTFEIPGWLGQGTCVLPAVLLGICYAHPCGCFKIVFPVIKQVFSDHRTFMPNKLTGFAFELSGLACQYSRLFYFCGVLRRSGSLATKPSTKAPADNRQN